MSICPNCNTQEAYIGLNEIECINPSCKFYKQKDLKNNGTTINAKYYDTLESIQRLKDIVKEKGWVIQTAVQKPHKQFGCDVDCLIATQLRVDKISKLTITYEKPRLYFTEPLKFIMVDFVIDTNKKDK